MTDREVIIIEKATKYSINPDRIKERIKARSESLYTFPKMLSVTERSFFRYLNQRKMFGDILLEISELLNCTPYYFLEPCPLIDDMPLQFWTYEFQTLSIPETRRQSLLVRGMRPEVIDSLTHE